MHTTQNINRQPWDWDSGSSCSSPSLSPPPDTTRIRPKPKPKTRYKTKPSRNIKIKIFHPNGHFIKLHVQSTIMIKDIKTKIENRLGIAIGSQQLLFQGKELNDESTWIESNFPTAIFLSILRHQMQIVIKTLSGKTIRMNVNEMDRIKSIKERIENEEGIATNHQRLLFGGKELKDDHVLSHYEIESGSTLYSALRFRNYNRGSADIRIHIKTTTNKTIAVLRVERSTCVQDIKRMIEAKTHVLFPFDHDFEEEPLIFAEQCLQNTLCLADYNIYNNSTLYLDDEEYYDAYDARESLLSSSSCTSSLSQIPEIQETFEIYVRIPQTGHMVRFEVDCDDTLKSIKTQIEKQELIQPEDQILTYLDKPLDDDKTLFDYNIDCQSELQLTLQGFAKFVTDKLL